VYEKNPKKFNQFCIGNKHRIVDIGTKMKLIVSNATRYMKMENRFALFSLIGQLLILTQALANNRKSYLMIPSGAEFIDWNLKNMVFDIIGGIEAGWVCCQYR